MAWEENSRICLHMQLIAILSRTGVEIIKNDFFKWAQLFVRPPRVTFFFLSLSGLVVF